MFINCVPQAEILDMASIIVPTTELTVEQVQENYNIAGGVAQLCLQRPDVTSQLLEGAFQSLELRQCWRSLERLSDKDKLNSITGEKLYPGLIVHICPTDPFRNQFTFKPWRLLLCCVRAGSGGRYFGGQAIRTGTVLMSYKDGVEYDKHHVFSQQELSNITPDDLVRWMC
jgi:hypothetical protein